MIPVQQYSYSCEALQGTVQQQYFVFDLGHCTAVLGLKNQQCQVILLLQHIHSDTECLVNIYSVRVYFRAKGEVRKRMMVYPTLLLPSLYPTPPSLALALSYRSKGLHRRSGSGREVPPALGAWRWFSTFWLVLSLYGCRLHTGASRLSGLILLSRSGERSRA